MASTAVDKLSTLHVAVFVLPVYPAITLDCPTPGPDPNESVQPSYSKSLELKEPPPSLALSPE
jgi:hypothetical protein